MHEITQSISQIPTGFWHVLLGAIILSPTVQGLKRLLKIQAAHHAFLLLSIVAMLAAAANYILHTPTANPSIIALQGSVLAFTAQPVYFILIKGLWQNVIQENIVEARKFNDMVKSAAVPADGLPIEHEVPAAPVIAAPKIVPVIEAEPDFS
jgi:hypothetical protein